MNKSPAIRNCKLPVIGCFPQRHLSRIAIIVISVRRHAKNVIERNLTSGRIPLTQLLLIRCRSLGENIIQNAFLVTSPDLAIQADTRLVPQTENISLRWGVRRVMDRVNNILIPHLLQISAGKWKRQRVWNATTPEHSPGFEQIVAQLMPEVDHSRTDPSLKQILEQRGRGPIKPQVELFVMSYCPYGVDAEKELLPFFSRYIDEIDFKLRFIVNKKPQSEGEIDDDPEFTSLHGETELIENLRQMVIAELYPDQFFDYLLCRADHLKEAWTLCAQKVGLDVTKIASTVDSTTGETAILTGGRTDKRIRNTRFTDFGD